jgi:Fe2+ or Zn2+ uptake regulation protein
MNSDCCSQSEELPIQTIISTTVRLTPGQKAVLSVLGKQQAAISAQSLFILMQKEQPLGLATVYRALDVLKLAGLIQHRVSISGEILYSVIEQDRHYLTCLQCGATFPVPICPIKELNEQLQGSSSFKIYYHILSIATVIGLVGVIETFLLYYFTEKHLGLPHEMVQTLIYLHLAVGGMMTIYVTRVQVPFWSIPPANKMLAATGLSVAISTVMACFGILMTPIGIMWTLASWGYTLVWFLIFDWVKLWLYRLLDPHQVVILGLRYLSHWKQLKRRF